MYVDSALNVLTLILIILNLSLLMIVTLALVALFADWEVVMFTAITGFAIQVLYLGIRIWVRTVYLPDRLMWFSKVLYLAGLTFCIYTLYKKRKPYLIDYTGALIIGSILGICALDIPINIMGLVAMPDDAIVQGCASLFVAFFMITGLIWLITEFIYSRLTDQQKVNAGIVIGILVLVPNLFLLIIRG